MRTPLTPYKVDAHVATLAPGIDPTKMNALADALEDEAIIAKMQRSARADDRKR